MDMHKLDILHQALDIPHFALRKFGFRCDAGQREIFRRADRRTILNCSRQIGKSTTAALKAVHMAYWRAGVTIIITAKSKNQTREFLRKARTFAMLCGVAVRGDRFTVNFHNGSRIVGLAANEDTVRSYSAVSLLIIDEASRVPDDVYFALLPMLAVSNGSIWLLSTPKGKRGFFYAEWISPHDPWVRVLIKAQDCPRISAEFLEHQKRRLGERRFAQEFEGVFIDVSAGVFDPEAVRRMFTDRVTPLDI